MPFQVVVADPPWLFGDRLPGPKRGASKHYGCLAVDELKAFELPPIADDALLFLWKVAAMSEEAYAVIRAWGFVPKSELVWLKRTVGGRRHMGMGHYVRAEHETCVIASRGKGIQLIANRSTRSVFEGQMGRHSEKPRAFYELVRELTTGDRCELFARRRHPGFEPFGNQVESEVA